MRPDRRDDSRLAAFEAATRQPMVVVSLAVIPVYVAQSLASDASSWVTAQLEVARTLIHLAMALDVGIRTYLAPQRRAFLIHHKVDVVAIAIPPIRALRELVALRTILFRPGVVRFSVVALAIVVGCALVVFATERDREGASIESLGDAFWWAAVTATTVGYGDEVPVTGQGRVVALLLMLLGIALFSVLTASVAAYFLSGHDRDAEVADVIDRLERIEATLTAVEQHLHGPPSDDTGVRPIARPPPDEIA